MTSLAHVADLLAGALAEAKGEPARQPSEDTVRTLLWEDGLLTAAVIGPASPTHRQLAYAVIGSDDQAVLAKQLAVTVTLNEVRISTILEGLDELGPRYTPARLRHPDEATAMLRAEAWAEGFMAGIALNMKEWQPIFLDDVGYAAIEPICLFMTSIDGGPLVVAPLPGELPELRRAALPRIGQSIFKLRMFWDEHLEDAKRHGGRLGKVGRNEPCPCGSGKKYKRCCLN